jgi:hypothetical protein
MLSRGVVSASSPEIPEKKLPKPGTHQAIDNDSGVECPSAGSCHADDVDGGVV